MASELLVRSYNVGCGDCVYVRIPHGDDGFHILIDCGTKESERTGILSRAIKHMEETMLPPVPGESWKRLDLLVVSHGHEDHIKGFDPVYFNNIQIDNIWITAGLDDQHEQAQKSRELHTLAKKAMHELARSGKSMSPELQELSALYGINNTGALTALTRTLPEANNIEPVFVHAGMTSTELGMPITDTTLSVLAPEKDIDHFYLGIETDKAIKSLADNDKSTFGAKKQSPEALPSNIGEADFRKLQSRLLSNALSFAVGDTQIQNNISTVLLIEWKGRRLLFVGDAEWSGQYREGKRNGSWNVMWHKRKEALAGPLDFLKVGHHGSHNATPWNRHADNTHEVNQILNAILPLPEQGEFPAAQCIVSTKRKQYDTIPDAELLAELGRRSHNTRNYAQHLAEQIPNFDPAEDLFNYSVLKNYSGDPSPREVGDKDWLDHQQPLRTDFESSGRGQADPVGEVEYVDVNIEAPKKSND